MKWSRQRVLVTGAAGFLGSHLTRTLTLLGAEVTAIDDLSVGARDKVDCECDFIVADVCDTNTFSKLVPVDYIFHFAGPSSDILFRENPQMCSTRTIIGLVNVFEFGRKIGINKLVYPSSGSVYGSCPIPQAENDAPRPQNLYGITKLACERIAQTYCPEVPNIGLRIFAGYGPGESHKGGFASVVTLFLQDCMAQRQPVIFGDGFQTRDFVYISDVIHAILRSAEGDANERILNVGSGRSHSFVELLNIVSNQLGITIKPIYRAMPEAYLKRTQADTSLLRRVMGRELLQLEEGIKTYLSEIPKPTY